MLLFLLADDLWAEEPDAREEQLRLGLNCVFVKKQPLSSSLESEHLSVRGFSLAYILKEVKFEVLSGCLTISKFYRKPFRLQRQAFAFTLETASGRAPVQE